MVGDEGKLRIDLPGDDCGLMEYSFLRSEFNSLTDFEWVGIVKNIELCECASGTFTFVNENGNQFGLITSDHYSYELHNLSGGEFLLGKINDTLVSRQLCKSNGSSNFNDNEPSIVERNGICKTRVLFLYTDAATTAPGISNLDAEARISITNLKTALISSGITSGEVDLEYAGLIHYPGFTETSNDIDIDLTELYTSPFVQNLRNLNFADMVVLLTEGNYFDANGSGGTIFGAVAEEPTPTGKRSSLGIPQDDLSYAIVEAEFTNVKYNTSHELGHLFGCRHQIEDDSHGTIEHGFSFRACNVWPFKKNWFTIMHTIRSEPGTTLGNQNGRLGQFSNPNIKFKGITTGTTNHNNNAQHIRNNSCSVANFRNNTALFSAFISGPDVLCENETVQLNSTVQNGLAPITLNWSYTINGTTFISLGGSANVSFSWNHHFEVGDLITIRLITTDALGNIITRYHHLEIIDQGCTKGKPAKSNSSGNFSDVSIYPNPTNDYLTLDAENQEFEYVVITNLNGIIVKRLFNFNASEKINISDLEKGVYNIMMKDLNGYHNRKIVKTE